MTRQDTRVFIALAALFSIGFVVLVGIDLLDRAITPAWERQQDRCAAMDNFLNDASDVALRECYEIVDALRAQEVSQ